MAAGSTYTPIVTTTLSSDAATVDFTSISGAYTDIRAVLYVRGATHLYCRIGNGSVDTGSNYSLTGIFGRSPSSPETGGEANTNQTTLRLTPFTYVPSATNEFGLVEVDFMNYSNTSTYKTVLTKSATMGSQSYAGTESSAQLWRSTSAINTMSFYIQSGNVLSGTTITLYGIKAA